MKLIHSWERYFSEACHVWSVMRGVKTLGATSHEGEEASTLVCTIGDNPNLFGACQFSTPLGAHSPPVSIIKINLTQCLLAVNDPEC